MPEMPAGHYSLEERDQLVLLNAFDVRHTDPHSALDIFSLDKNVLVLLTGHFPMLPQSTTFLMKRGRVYPFRRDI